MESPQPGTGGPDGPNLTQHEFRALLERLRKATPWGPSDRRGALNYITPALVVAALSEVKLGQSISLGAPIEYEPAADNPDPSHHKMTQVGQDAPAVGLSFAMDRIGMNIHGNADTHIDALCHVIYDGKLYNNIPAETVTDQGAGDLPIGAAADGIVGRGVLLDIPRWRGAEWLEPGDQVGADDLAAAEAHEEVVLGEGDLAFVRVGHRSRRAKRGPWDAASARAGLHPAAMEWLADRKIGLLGSDGNNDAAPSAVTGVDFPVHVLAVTGLGLHLIDYLDFLTLARRCAELRKWSFLCVIAPLRLPRATGSPVNPIAVF
jgi:kynurenine formamidase